MKRYVKEFANDMKHDLASANRLYHSLDEIIDMQERIDRVVHFYDTGLITKREALREILEIVEGVYW